MPAIEKICPLCQKYFLTHPFTPHQIYCSKQCYRKIEREKNKEKISEKKKKWRQKNIEKIKQNAKIYYQKNKEKIIRKKNEWEKKNTERVKELKQRWILKQKDNPSYLERRRINSQKAYEKKVKDNPDWWKDRYKQDSLFSQKVTARHLAKIAFDEGKIERKGCRICGEFAEMHHPDYAKPLEVDWLCHPCHMETHKKS